MQAEATVVRATGAEEVRRPELDVDQIPPGCWLLLGQVIEQCAHLRELPVFGDDVARLQQRCLAWGVAGASALGGTPIETAAVEALVAGTDHGLPGVVTERLRRLLDLHGELGDSLAPVTVDHILGWHRRLAPAGGGHGAERPDVGGLAVLSDVTRNLQGSLGERVDARGRAQAILAAHLAHADLVATRPLPSTAVPLALHTEMQVLVRAGVPVPVALLLPGEYAARRRDHTTVIEDLRRDGDAVAFVYFALDRLHAALSTVSRWLCEDGARRAYALLVEQRVQGSSAAGRRRILAMALADHGSPVRRKDLRSFSPEVADCYQNKRLFTLTRDIARLQELGLVEDTPEGYRASVEQVRGLAR